ncbi:MAG TPA: D-alanyl-D-alanine carboxypeptidase/D-alanyl-D-alanine-endopeptidase [Gemmatimonadetes bacterium]|nr:D-alanyl-D-alanine carboxypeptidase/D-alanyl-D-alanine-endopeptidase [Gemmatimonadota bacterium]
MDANSHPMKKHPRPALMEARTQSTFMCARSTHVQNTDSQRVLSRASRGVSSLVVITLSAGCALLGGTSGGIDRDAADAILDAPPLDQVHFGVLAVELRTGHILYSRNAHQKFVPASNQKILVTATAISLLGPNYRYGTEVWATGSVMGSLLDGDLVILASGDPSMSDRYWESGEATLAAIADSLYQKGLRDVAGSVFVDVSAWDSTTVGPTWEVEDLRFTHGATGGAFAIDEGEISVIIRAGPAVGSPATLEWSPVGTPDYVRARITTVPPDSGLQVRPSYLPETRLLELTGQIELYKTDTLMFALRDPVRQATAALGTAIERAGIKLQSGAHIAWSEGYRVGRGCLSGSVRECPNAGLVLTLESPPLSDLIAGILKPSQNWMTEQLIRTLGAELGEKGSWSEGVRIMTEFLTEVVAVDSLDISPRDGSGLSAYNLVTPRALVRILQYLSSDQNSGAYRSAMASPGEEDSTLEERLLGLEGRVFAKTGTISNVNSLSGYLTRDDGSEVVFSILSNGSGLPSGQVRAAIDDLVRILAR